MTTWKTIALTRQTFVGKVMSLLFNMQSSLVIAFLPRSKHLLITWLQSPSAEILVPKLQSQDTEYLESRYRIWSQDTEYFHHNKGVSYCPFIPTPNSFSNPFLNLDNPNILSIYIILPFKECYINAIIQHITSCDWLFFMYYSSLEIYPGCCMCQ